MEGGIFQIMRGAWTFVVDGTPLNALQLGLKRTMEGIDDFTPFWLDYIAPKFYADVIENFASEGRLVGGWLALSPAYAAWKARAHPSMSILRLTDRMRLAVTNRNDPNALFEVTPKTLRIGARGDVGARLAGHQRGVPSRHLPARPVLFLRSRDEYRGLMRAWFHDQARKNNVPVAAA